MKKYRNILSILILAMCFISIVGVFWAFAIRFIDGAYGKALAALLILIPIYIIGHYVLLTRRYESATDELSIKAKKSILYSNLIFWSICLIVPLFISTYFVLQYNEASKGKKWPTTGLFGDEISMLTKYDKGIKYQLRAKFSVPKSVFKKKYTAILLDNDGFEIESFQIENYTTVRNELGGKINGVISKGNNRRISLKEYLKINNIEFSVTD